MTRFLSAMNGDAHPDSLVYTEFEIPLNATYNVTEWSVQTQGGPPQKNGTGDKLTPDAIAYLRQAKSGSKIIISVKYSGMGYSGNRGASIITVE